MGFTNFFKNLSTVEIVVIAGVIMLLFGPQILKKIGKTSGETVKELKGIKKSISEAVEEPSEDSANTTEKGA